MYSDDYDPHRELCWSSSLPPSTGLAVCRTLLWVTCVDTIDESVESLHSANHPWSVSQSRIALPGRFSCWLSLEFPKMQITIHLRSCSHCSKVECGFVLKQRLTENIQCSFNSITSLSIARGPILKVNIDLKIPLSQRWVNQRCELQVAHNCQCQFACLQGQVHTNNEFTILFCIFKKFFQSRFDAREAVLDLIQHHVTWQSLAEPDNQILSARCGLVNGHWSARYDSLLKRDPNLSNTQIQGKQNWVQIHTLRSNAGTVWPSSATT